MRGKKNIFVLLLLVLALSACTGEKKEESKYNISGNT